MKKRRKSGKLSVRVRVASMAVVAGILPAGLAKADLLFDNMSATLLSAPNANATLLPTTGNVAALNSTGGQFSIPAGAFNNVGLAITVPAGTTDITGFDGWVDNNTAATTGVYMLVYFWGKVNTGIVNASNPAFSNLLTGAEVNLGSLAAGYNLPVEYPSGLPSSYGGPGLVPGIGFSAPFNLPAGTTTIGITVSYLKSTTSKNVLGLDSLIPYNVAPTAGGYAVPGIYYNVSLSTANTSAAPAQLQVSSGSALPNAGVAFRLYGDVAGFNQWSNSSGGAWETSTNWSQNASTIDSTDAGFNLSSPSGYTLTVNASDICKDVYVENDNVTLSFTSLYTGLNISGGSIYNTTTGLVTFNGGQLVVGLAPAGSNTATGVLNLTNLYTVPVSVTAGSVNVGMNGGTGTLTIGSYMTLTSANAVTIGAGSALNLSGGNLSNGTPSGILTAPSVVLAGSAGAWTGKIDIGTHALDLSSATLATVTSQAAFGYNGGKWNASGGITSSAAASDTLHISAVGVISNNIATNQAWMGANAPTGALYGSNGSLGNFEGLTTTGLNDVLVKYTYYGDCLLQGNVTGSDYSIVDNTYLNENFSHGVATSPIGGWYNGDFNYDGVVDGSDYTLMDNAFNQQSTLLLNDAVPSISSPTSDGTDSSSGNNVQYIDRQYQANLVQFATPTTLVAGGSAVPEPTSLGLLAIGSLGLLVRRGRRV